MITGAQVASSAHLLVDIPFQKGGRNSHGLDCFGVPMLACLNSGLTLPPAQKAYGKRIGSELIDWVQRHCAAAEGRPLGGLAVFRFERDQFPVHVGVISDVGIVHCNARLGRVVEHGLRAQWARWLHSVWLLPGVDYR